jgi:integrase
MNKKAILSVCNTRGRKEISPMHIKQIGDEQKWLLDVRIKKDGKQYRRRETFDGCKKNAELRYWTLKKELLTAAENGNRSFSNENATFKNIIDYYLERTTIDMHSKHYFKTLKNDLGNVPVSEIRNKFDKYLLLLRKTKVKNTGNILSNNTINKFIAWSKAAFNCAVRGGIVEQNPLQYFQKLPTRPRDRMLTEDEKKKLLETVEKEAPHIYPIVLYSMLVPARIGELLALKRTDYNMVTNTIHIPAEITKMKRPCIKPVPACLIKYMRNIPKESTWLFYRQIGGRYLPIGDFRGTWKACLKIAKIENYKFHDSRRGAYTALLLAGNLPHIVMQVSGHATDMSKVYFGRNEMNAAKSIDFKECTLGGTLEGNEVMQSAVK